jgi:hypothetical protein
MYRRFFPSTEPATTENEDEWEEVKEGESAENGVAEVAETKKDGDESEAADETPKVSTCQVQSSLIRKQNPKCNVSADMAHSSTRVANGVLCK